MRSRMALHLDASTWASESSKQFASLALRCCNICPTKTHMAHLLLAPFASHLYELAALLKEVQREAEIGGAYLPNTSRNDVESQLKAAEQLVEEYAGRNSLYLLMCCPDLLHHLKHLHTGLRAALDSFAHHEGWSSALKVRFSDEIKALQQSGSMKLGPKEQSLHDSLEHGVLDSIVTDVTLTIKLARQIAESLGFSSLDSQGFGDEIASLKREKDEAERRHGMAHALYLQQFTTLLEKARDSVSKSGHLLPSVPEHDRMPLAQGCGALPAARDTLILPLQSFICPITRDVMKDPVQIASGQTYERIAIETWFAEGHTRCPTGVELANTHMKSNIALKQSIAEWKERNNAIRLDVAADLLTSASTEQQLRSLRDLEALCREESLYKYRVASKWLVPVLVNLAESGNLEVRLSAVSMLELLADNEECQEIMVREKVIELVVRCLARQNDEAVHCVKLMHTLSSNQAIAEKISRVPSAVLFLVTLIRDDLCADNVNDILENLPKSDENIIIMAEANIMKPLILRLNQGGASASKILMAKTLGRLHLPDSSKAVAATGETIRTLTSMAESLREEESESAVMALESLSSVAAARQGLLDAGAFRALLKIMKGMCHSEAAKRASAATLANIWAADDCAMKGAELEDAICTFFQMLGPPTPVQVQVTMLQGLLGLARSSSDFARLKMKENDAFSCLLLLSFQSSSNELDCTHVRLQCPCWELLARLAFTFPDEAASAIRLHPAAIHGLAQFIKLDNRPEPELLAATSFITCLPSKDLDIYKMMVQEPEFLQSLASLFKHNRNEAIVEAAAGALLRFTVSGNVTVQGILAKAGVISAYVCLLRSGGPLAREWAGKALCNFSKSSWELSLAAAEAMNEVGGGLCMWAMCFSGGRWRWNRSRMCRVHGGQCSVEGTFCLVEADAVMPLAEVVRDNEGGVAASLMALATLVEEGEGEEGCAAIERASGWRPIIHLMGSRSEEVQEKAAQLCEKLFTFPHFRIQYAGLAQMHIISLAQQGTPPLKQLAGRLLRQMELLHSQSNYLGVASLTTT